MNDNYSVPNTFGLNLEEKNQKFEHKIQFWVGGVWTVKEKVGQLRP